MFEYEEAIDMGVWPDSALARGCCLRSGAYIRTKMRDSVSICSGRCDKMDYLHVSVCSGLLPS